VAGLTNEVAAHLAAVAADTLADVRDGEIPSDARQATVALEAGPATIALRRAA
jgi:hypothetical protein